MAKWNAELIYRDGSSVSVEDFEMKEIREIGVEEDCVLGICSTESNQSKYLARTKSEAGGVYTGDDMKQISRQSFLSRFTTLFGKEY